MCPVSLFLERRRSSIARATAMCVVVLLSFSAAACSALTDVDAPDLVQPANLENAAGAQARRAGAIARLARAFSDQVTNSGVLADEFTDVGDAWPADRRTITANNTGYPFATLSLARIDALRAAAALKEYDPSASAEIGELYALVGMVNVMFVENLCTPLPVATVVNGNPVDAPPQSRDMLLDGALAMFDSADAYGDASAPGKELAALGRGRAYLADGELELAADAVANVPETFVYAMPFSASIVTQQNQVFRSINVSRTLSVADSEGRNGLPFVTASDVRVAARLVGTGRNGRPLYNYAGDSSLGASITLASGVEAALMRAEAYLNAGDVPAWESVLDHLRLTFGQGQLAPLPADSSSAASEALRVDVTFRERAFWLFGTGHRQGDLRRLVRRYGREASAVFPTGEYPTQGLQYGNDVTFLPRGEEPNPAYGGCEDRGA